MRRCLVVTFAGVLIILGMPSCILGFQQLRGSGHVTSVDLSQQGFTGVHLGYGSRSHITYAPDYSVVVRIDDNLAQYLDVERNGAELSISLKPHFSYRGITFEVDIAMPDLERLRLSGGSKCALSGFSLDHDVDLGLSGGSELDGSVTAQRVSFSLSGGSGVELMGQGTSSRLDGSGGSHFDLGDFETQDVRVSLSGGSNATIRVSDELSGSLSGGSQVRYIGNPTLGKISKSGGADIRPK
ncbi:MAG: DUF2807 domain-containing protein [Acidobacteriota bacterium]